MQTPALGQEQPLPICTPKRLLQPQATERRQAVTSRIFEVYLTATTLLCFSAYGMIRM